MDTPISRAEHEEFRRSMELANQNLADENHRQNRRLDILEENAKAQTTLALSVERLATNMENMLKEQKEQGKRLETLESRGNVAQSYRLHCHGHRRHCGRLYFYPSRNVRRREA